MVNTYSAESAVFCGSTEQRKGVWEACCVLAGGTMFTAVVQCL